MKKIQVLTTRPWNSYFPFLSWLIRLFQLSKESNIVWYFPEKKIIRDVYFNKIREIDIDKFMENNRLVNVKTLKLSEEQYKRIDKYTASKLGAQSGYFKTLIGFFISQFFKLLSRVKIKNPFFKGMTSPEFIREGARKIDELFVFISTCESAPGNLTTTKAMDLISELSDHLNYKKMQTL